MTEPAATGSLENQLRNMILSNVTVSDGPAVTRESHQQPSQGRGRGRGRGGAVRGRGGNNTQVDREQPTPRNPTGDTNVAAGQGRGRGRGRGGNTSNWRQPPLAANPLAANQPPKQNGPIRTPASAQQPPKILQRPAGAPNANPVNGGPARTAYKNAPKPQAARGQLSPNQLAENPMAQVAFLDHLASQEVPKAEMTLAELKEKEVFNLYLEQVLQKAFAENYSGDDIADIKLVGFGSLASGFATPGSDMDMAVVPVWKDPANASKTGINRDIPRLLEKVVLDAKMGGRLLTRTRVPILKVCQSPTEELAKALLEERQKWDDLPEEEQYPSAVAAAAVPSQPALNADEFPTISASKKEAKKPQQNIDQKELEQIIKKVMSSTPPTPLPPTASGDAKPTTNGPSKEQQQPHQKGKPFLREKILGPLDFPKDGVGIQCDINFDNPLGIHNTRLLRCYSLCDPRVRPIVLFVKAWAKRRKINSSYSGTLSSYGWVLMVLHYLVNIAQPPVCPNLQTSWRAPANMDMHALEAMFKETTIAGYNIRFFDNEAEIIEAAQSRRLTTNNQSVGALLRGFFQYFASAPQPFGYGAPRSPTFYWTNEVLSLRTPNGIRAKAEKGWTGAKTTVGENGKEVRHRYLFAIEDPFEYDHNVARTVTHFGIVAIRDEFRRAWRILSAVGRGVQPEGGIFDEIVEAPPPSTPSKESNTAESSTVDGVSDGKAKMKGETEAGAAQKKATGPAQHTKTANSLAVDGVNGDITAPHPQQTTAATNITAAAAV